MSAHHRTLIGAIALALGSLGCERVVRTLVEPTEKERSERAELKQRMVVRNAVSKANFAVRENAVASAGVALGASFCDDASWVFENHSHQAILSSCKPSFLKLEQVLRDTKVCRRGTRDDKLYCKATQLADAQRTLEQQKLTQRVCADGSWATTRSSKDVESSTLTLRACALDVGEPLSDLLADPEMKLVTEIILEDASLTTAAWDALLTAPALTRDAPLARVALTRTPLDDASQDLLVRHLWRAKEHVFEETGVRASIIDRLSAPSLQTLAFVDEPRVDDAFLEKLGVSLEAPALDVLVLVAEGYGDKGLDAIAPLLSNAHLVSLSLARSRAGDAAIARAIGALPPRDERHNLLMLDLAHTAAAKHSAAAIVALQKQRPDAFSSLCLDFTKLSLAHATSIVDAIDDGEVSTSVFLHDGSEPSRYWKLFSGRHEANIAIEPYGCGWGQKAPTRGERRERRPRR